MCHHLAVSKVGMFSGRLWKWDRDATYGCNARDLTVKCMDRLYIAEISVARASTPMHMDPVIRANGQLKQEVAITLYTESH